MSKNKYDDNLYLKFQVPEDEIVFEFLLGRGSFVFPIKIYADNIKRPIICNLEILWEGKDLSKRNNSNFSVKRIEKAPEG